MFLKLKKWLREFRLSLRMKMTLSFSAIAVVLLMSSVISILEYRHMSNYVSTMIANDISNIHVTQNMIDAVDAYNLRMLAVIGDDGLSSLPDFNRTEFMSRCDSLRLSFVAGPLADSVVYAYSAYMLASLELEDVFESNFIDSRDWYFNRLQPIFGRMRGYLDKLSTAMYSELQENSANFDRGFYRSIIPGAVAVSVAILLVFMLLFYIMAYYVKPIYRMRDALKDFLQFRHRYTYEFENTDQLGELNESITNLTEENRNLRRRISEMKENSK